MCSAHTAAIHFCKGEELRFRRGSPFSVRGNDLLQALVCNKIYRLLFLLFNFIFRFTLIFSQNLKSKLAVKELIL